VVRSIGSAILRLASTHGAWRDGRDSPNTTRTPLARSNSASVSNVADVPPITLASDTAMIRR
jgi:hypothetical protein